MKLMTTSQSKRKQFVDIEERDKERETEQECRTYKGVDGKVSECEGVE